MAGLIQDSNTNATHGHSATAMKKGGLLISGRKPLGDLSNSGNPFLEKASEKMVTKKNCTLTEEEIGARAKKNISKASDIGTRKALSDISNSNRKQTSKKKQNRTLTAVTEEPCHEKGIADEMFLHNHQECIKAQRQALDIDHFLKTVGLNGCPKELPSLNRPESPPPRLLEEMLELPISDRSAKKFDYSPPKSPDHYHQLWEGGNDCISLNLLDTPKLVKH